MVIHVLRQHNVRIPYITCNPLCVHALKSESCWLRIFAQTVLVCPQINQPTERLQIHLFHALLDDVRKHWRNYTLHSPSILSLSRSLCL
jgi:hypothetical protein